jgi:hypothetical protein
MFILVRAAYELVLSSIKLYRSAILPSVFQAGLDCEIQPGSIGAGLTTRYDFAKHFAPFVAHPSTVIGFRRGIILIPFRYVNCSGIINFLDQVLDLSTQGEKTFSPSSPKAVSPSSFFSET